MLNTLNIAYLSMASLENFECYDSLTFEPMAHYGYKVTEIPWRDEVDWSTFDYVVIRSPWDYQDDASSFLQVLNNIEASSAQLLNPLRIIEWNINKHYLQDLASKGIPIVPTQWGENLTSAQLNATFKQFDADELIIKPAISANADDTYRIKRDSMDNFLQSHAEKFMNRGYLLQPFMSAIIEEGEYSLFYFNGELSHCILKTPKTDDFRVQEEHGGRLSLIDQPETDLVSCGQRCLEAIPERLLYARLDFVRYDHSFVLMEAELIEPSLYFNLDADSPVRFAKAFDNFVHS